MRRRLNRTTLLNAWLYGGACLLSAAAWAQGDAPLPTRYAPRTLLEGIASTLIFGIIGIVLSILGFKLFDAAISFNVEREICENKNMAAAVLAGSVVLGICIIVAVLVI